MNWKHRHIIGICFLLCCLWGFVACTDESPEFPRKEESNPIFLTFQADVAGVSTRADGSVADDSRVETLRIVIVSQSKENETWEVEHNGQVSLGSSFPQTYTYQVAPNSLKRIYLIANEESLVDTEGKRLDFSDAQFIPKAGGNAPVDNYVFDVSRSPYTPSALPMTGLYEIEVPTLDEIKNGTFEWPNPLYLVRAATKFTFEFTNRSTRKAITVTGIDINRVITDRMYLMPHVNKRNGQYWVVEEMETGGNVTYTEKPVEDWVDWMGQEAKDSETGADNEWLTDYEVPKAATVTTAPVSFNKEIPTGESVKIPDAIYLPESKTVKDEAGNEFQLQEYSFTVHTTEEGEACTYSDVKLPHLASLFRNTHVKVGIIFKGKSIEWIVDVIPFTSVELKPDYGLVREEFTGYIIGQDKEGRKCWYDGNYYDPATAVPLYLGPKDHPGEFVSINSKEYLLVYADYERTAANLDHFFEKESRKKYLLYPAGRTGYENVNWAYYLNDLKQRVWLDESNLRLNCYRTLNEWDRLEYSAVAYNWPGYDHDNINPKYWFDILGNRYPWSEGDTEDKRKAKLGEWVKYLE